MNEENDSTVSRGFWIIGIVALIWNLMGVMNFFMQMNADVVASMPESHRAIVEGRPAWATGGFALAVFGGAVGCILLLLRKSAANYLFIASLIGVIVQGIHSLGIPEIEFSASDILLIILMPLVVAVFLIWWSKRAESKGLIS